MSTPFQAYKNEEPQLRALLLPTGLEVDVHPIYEADLYYSGGLAEGVTAKLMFVKKESDKLQLKFMAYIGEPIVYSHLMYTTVFKRNAVGDYPQITGEPRVEGEASVKWRLTEEQLAIVDNWIRDVKGL